MGGVPATPPTVRGSAPEGFHIDRSVPLGRHDLLTVFPGLDRLPTAERQESDPVRRQALHRGTVLDVVADDIWMYVAPWTPYPGRWPHVVTPALDCIVVGEGHLRESDPLTLFLDIFHELCHVQQRRGGADLYGGDLGYADKPTEVEAYRFVVREARELGVDDPTLQEYLRVEWLDPAGYGRLLDACGVPRPT